MYENFKKHLDVTGEIEFPNLSFTFRKEGEIYLFEGDNIIMESKWENFLDRVDRCVKRNYKAWFYFDYKSSIEEFEERGVTNANNKSVDDLLN